MVEDLLVVAAESGIAIARLQAGDWILTQRSLEDQAVTSLVAAGQHILAGTRNGVYRSTDLGKTWVETNTGLSIGHVRWLEQHPDRPGRVIAGTEPAGIFVSEDWGSAWRSCPEVEAMRRQYGWALPYSPEAGCVRGFAFREERGYAAVEDGCVLVSSDGGETWELSPGSRGFPDHAPRAGFIHSDVHSISVHPTQSGRVAAPTGGGFYLSDNGGETWADRYRYHYTRAVWLDPADPDHMVLGPADGVDRNGRIEETQDGGLSWQGASRGLQVPWQRHMVERFAQAGSQLLAVLSNGDLFAAEIRELNWRQVLAEVSGVNAVTHLQVEE